MKRRLIILLFLLVSHATSGAAGSTSSHWAFLPVSSPKPPAVRERESVRTPIDNFIVSKLEANQLQLALPADKRTLLRRATYDLTGLPPTPDEVDAFLADKSPDAFSKVIERLLASPHYGEHWGRHWLDVVRYADTAGENSDHPLPHAWRYRNWVIDAFNGDKPYDEFIREQVAGDLMATSGPPEKFAERTVATGYLAIARRFGHDIDKDMHLTFEDTIDNLGKTVLGLTLGCARCHDHKYDPVTARDYYGLYGIFESTKFAFPGCEPQQLPRDLISILPPQETERLRQPFDAELVKFDSVIKAREADLAESKKEKPEPSPERIKALTAAVTEARKQRGEFSRKNPVPYAYAVTEANVRNSKLQRRGDPTQPGEEIPRKFLDVLGGQTVPTTNQSGRLELAKWLTSPTNPLTARVMVNRIWQGHFARGLVPTPNDFGTRGQPPTHPELLDWLAGAFVKSGWSVKAMNRLIMASAVYQQAAEGAKSQESGVSESCSGIAIPSDTRHLTPDTFSPFPRRRLTAEELRDTLLAVTGELDRAPGEAHPFPPEDKWSYTQHGPFADNYETLKRSVYAMQKRNRRTPFFALFDGPDPNASTATRDLTTVPTQALYFMNDQFVHDRAAKFATLIFKSASDDRARFDFACRHLFGRIASAEEQTEASEFLREYEDNSADQPAEHQAALAWAAYARVLFGSNELIYVD